MMGATSAWKVTVWASRAAGSVVNKLKNNGR